MWGLSYPEFEDENKLQGGKKVMCWGALMNGKVILHWFNLKENINPEVYLNMLKTVLWPKVRCVVTRQRLWFQQDVATSHTTVMNREWLSAAKFGNMFISRFTARPWPSKKSLSLTPGLLVLVSVPLRAQEEPPALP